LPKCRRGSQLGISTGHSTKLSAVRLAALSASSSSNKKGNVMVVSRNTVAEILRVIERSFRDLPKERIRVLLKELSEVPGNKSYRDTIALMRKQYPEN
jgi:hypothetical protein